MSFNNTAVIHNCLAVAAGPLATVAVAAVVVHDGTERNKSGPLAAEQAASTGVAKAQRKSKQ